jgi:uncharacterized membrane protein
LIFYRRTLFLLSLFWFTVLWTLGVPLSITLFVKIGVGLLITIMGNYMGKVRQTWIFGIRTPWTLSDEEVWDKTHRFGGWSFFLAGVLMMVLAFWDEPWTFWVGIGGILLGALIPVVYSYVIFKGKENRGQTPS